jgi:hypothetical protein
MGEEEIITFLEIHKKEYFSLKEICQALIGKANTKSILRSIKQLNKFKEINSMKIDVNLSRKIYGKNMKRGLTLYYIKD